MARGFRLASLQTAWVRERLQMPPNAPIEEMKLLLANGGTLGGADALVEIARHIWWAWPVTAFAGLPGGLRLLRMFYRRFAANRYCLGGRCVTSRAGEQRLREAALRRTRNSQFVKWLPFLLLVAGAVMIRNMVPNWVFMWLIAFAIFLGCKWVTFSRALEAGANPGLARSLGYLFAWPGMDAGNFLRSSRRKEALIFSRITHHASRNDQSLLTSAATMMVAGLRTMLGSFVLWTCARHRFDWATLLTGWLAMFGIILTLHFGLFDLLACLWQRAGIEAKPVMRAPLRSTSLAEFWSTRWNTAFNTLAHTFAFRPLTRRWGIGAATMGVFLISGFVHEAVISLPARGGYGLPTGYFLLQGCGVLLERSVIGRRLGLGRGVPGWLFTFAFTAIPVFWLFHPPFVLNVILPMLNALGTK
jgi:alginate O-acetyltransferase complex protein AlgI